MKVAISHLHACVYWASCDPFTEIPELGLQKLSLSGFAADVRLFGERRNMSAKEMLRPPETSDSSNTRENTARKLSDVIGAEAPFPAELLDACLPVDVLVESADDRRPSELFCCHVVSGKIPAMALVKVNDSVFVSSPEFCFLQVASSLSLPQLIRFGFELCGSYSLRPADARGFVTRKPLTSSYRMGKLLTLMSGRHGAKFAKHALGKVLDGSASPMETIVVMLLTLPRHKGGYGLPKPVLNQVIRVPESRLHLATQELFACDLLWPDAKIAVEYDSDMFHTGPERIARDARRRNMLETLGIRTITITKSQVFNERECDLVAAQIAKMLGVRLRAGNRSYDEAKAFLRAELLGGDDFRFR